MDKSYVTMEQALCPVCGKTHDTGNLLLDKSLKPRFERFTTTGYGLCAVCKKKDEDGFIALVVIDPQKSMPTGDMITMENAHRTGKLIHMRRSVATDIFNNLDAGRPFVFIDTELAEKLEAMTKNV